MGFSDSVRKVLSNYAVFEGRAARPELWWFVLFYLLAQFVAGMLDGVVFPGDSWVLLTTLVTFGLFVPYLAVAVRRLHDTDRTGWWLLLSLVPIIGVIVLIVFTVQRGTPGPNRFGEEPLGTGTRDTLTP